MAQNKVTPQDTMIMQLRSTWQLNDVYKLLLDKYVLRVWDIATFRLTQENAINQRHEGQIYFEGDWYSIHWMDLPTVIKDSKLVGCSFRKHNGKCFVLVKKWSTNYD